MDARPETEQCQLSGGGDYHGDGELVGGSAGRAHVAEQGEREEEVAGREMGLDGGVPKEGVAGVGRGSGGEDAVGEVGAAEGSVEGDNLGSKEGVGGAAGGDEEGVVAAEGEKVRGVGGEEEVEIEVTAEAAEGACDGQGHPGTEGHRVRDPDSNSRIICAALPFSPQVLNL